jgi:predicted acetyltransferase
VDVNDALSQRTYVHEERLVFEIQDTFCPWNDGTYELEGSPQGATCAPTTKAADISLSAGDLAAAYLGATTFTALARAGRAQENTSKIFALADNMFRADLQPWWSNEF